MAKRGGPPTLVTVPYLILKVSTQNNSSVTIFKHVTFFIIKYEILSNPGYTALKIFEQNVDPHIFECISHL